MFHVMIVDDELSVLEGLTYTMPWDEMEVEQVYSASSAASALEQLNRHHVDIVITDIRMPGMNGLELIREIRRKWSGIRCIILSGHGEFDYAREAIRAETTDYLLKPIMADELVETVRGVQAKLREEWERISVFRETVSALHEHRPLLSGKALGDIVSGRAIGREQLARKTAMLGLPFAAGDSAALLLIRLEEEFYHPERVGSGLQLMEYAVCNITEEIFGKHFHTWCYVDPQSYLVFALKAHGEADEHGGEGAHRLIERLAAQVQQNVLTYLKGNISIMVSGWGVFPDDLPGLYAGAQTAFRKFIGSDSGLFYSLGDEAGPGNLAEAEPEALQEPYKQPTLLGLLDIGGWDEAEAKLAAIMGELKGKFADSREHWTEVFFAVASTFSHIAHKNGKPLAEALPGGVMPAGNDFRSTAQLETWATGVLRALKTSAEESRTDTRRRVMRKAQSYIEEHLGGDVSLQAIADHIHFHPVYLSKLYKKETGATLSDYIHSARMDKAIELLRETELKVYEIAQRVGYENTYFNKVFKKQFGMTPQEFRDSS